MHTSFFCDFPQVTKIKLFFCTESQKTNCWHLPLSLHKEKEIIYMCIVSVNSLGAFCFNNHEADSEALMSKLATSSATSEALACSSSDRCRLHYMMLAINVRIIFELTCQRSKISKSPKTSLITFFIIIQSSI